MNDYAFSGCIYLTDVTFSAAMTKIPYGAFTECEALTDITIPENITLIDEWAFYGCTNLKKITIENSECSIYDSGVTICHSYDGANAKAVFSGTIYGHDNSTGMTNPKEPNKKDYNLKEFSGMQAYINDCIKYKAEDEYEITHITVVWNSLGGNYEVYIM